MVAAASDDPAGRRPAAPHRVSVVVVAYGAEPWLEDSVWCCLTSKGVRVDVVLVDNGCTDGAVDRLDGTPGVQVLRPGSNLGFAGGCNAGAEQAEGEFLALVNPDARIGPDALAHLVEAAREPGVGLVTGSLRLAGRNDLLNAAGTDVHFLGMSWCRAFEEPAADHASRVDVAGASGAFCLLRRDLWQELGGFDGEFFAYLEDADLSLRVWQSGRRVVFVPDAVAEHRYEFSRNPRKFFLLDRNRMIAVLSLFETRTLLVVSPLLLLQELALMPAAAAQGWLPQRLAAIRWMVVNRGWVARRRRRVALTRRVGDRDLTSLFTEVVQPGNYPLPGFAVVAQWPLRWYWRVARRLL